MKTQHLIEAVFLSLLCCSKGSTNSISSIFHIPQYYLQLQEFGSEIAPRTRVNKQEEAIGRGVLDLLAWLLLGEVNHI
jgi:hypothetical protein